MSERHPVEVFPPAAYIEEELAARGKDLVWLLEEAAGAKKAVLAVTRGEHMTIRAASALADIFETSTILWWSIDAVWWEWSAREQRKAKG